MKITLIAAVAQNNAIGRDGDIPWYFPEDLKRFSRITKKHPVIMGRKTAESVPEKFWPLRKRVNYVLTRNQDYVPRKNDSPNIYVVHSLEEALESINNNIPNVAEIDYTNSFVIGGESLYREAMPLADALEITHVHSEYEGDTFFPEIDSKIWQEVARKDFEKYSFVRYDKK